MKKLKNWLVIGVSLVVGLCWVGPVLAEVTLEVLNPRGEIAPPPTLVPAPRVTELAGKKIGIFWNGKQGGNNFWDVIEELLKERFPTATILRFKGPFDIGDRLAGTMAKEVDTFIYGVGD
jgi:hypothetical protein